MKSSFTKVCIYDCPHEDVKTVFSKKKLKTTDEYKLCNVTVYDMRLRHEDVKTVSTLESIFECMHIG